jgi:molybdopterin/thiamine biosynthesis adenylyltransferase
MAATGPNPGQGPTSPPGLPPPNPSPYLTAAADPAARKYDRQLRVWGADGQAALAGARVCLLGAGATGSEALKNLVLGGIAAYTVIDDALVRERRMGGRRRRGKKKKTDPPPSPSHSTNLPTFFFPRPPFSTHTKVTPTDLGNNFLVSAADVGRPRAAAVAARAAELNPGVAASFAVDSPADLAVSRPGVCSGFSLVIAAGLPWPALEALDASLRAAGVPLVVARSYGLGGFVRVRNEMKNEMGERLRARARLEKETKKLHSLPSFLFSPASPSTSSSSPARTTRWTTCGALECEENCIERDMHRSRFSFSLSVNQKNHFASLPLLYL